MTERGLVPTERFIRDQIVPVAGFPHIIFLDKPRGRSQSSITLRHSAKMRRHLDRMHKEFQRRIADVFGDKESPLCE